MAGLRVLDLTRVIAGPVATRTLGLLGADVLRIDAPGLPEADDAHADTGFGKRSARLDLADADDRAVFDGLLDRADVVVAGYRPGTLDRYGLGAEELLDRRPGLVVANHSGVLPWDGAMINLAIRHEHPARRECRMLALDMFALMPFLAPIVAKSGGVRANQENGERLLRRGELVAVFPEGVKGVGKPFKNRYRLARFGRGGFVRLALRTQAPIVPCAVVGAEEIHPLLANLSWLARPFGVPYLPVTPTFPALGPLGFVPLPSKWYG